MRCVAIGLGLCLGLTASTGCYHYKFTTGMEPAGTQGWQTQQTEEWQHIWAFGYVPDEPFDLESACGGGEVAEFGSYVSLTNSLATLATLTFYSPKTAYAVCAK